MCSLDGGDLSVLGPGHFTSGCLGPRAGLDAVAERSSVPLPRIEPRSSSP